MAVAYGTIAIVPKGVWNAGTEYNVGHLVELDGSSYVAKAKPPVGTLPTNTAYWQVSATGTSKATADNAGVVKPDGVTTKVDENAALSVKTAQQNAVGVVKGSAGIKVGVNGSLDVNTDFKQAAALANIIAGEAIAQVLGKVSKAIATTMNLDQNALLKNMLTGIDVNDANKVPNAAFIHTLVERIGMGTDLGYGFTNLTAAVNSVKKQADDTNSNFAAVNNRITPENVRLHTSSLYVEITDSYYKMVKLKDIGLEGKKLPTYPLLLGSIITDVDNTLEIARLRRDNDDGFTIIFNKTFTAALAVSLLVSVDA